MAWQAGHASPPAVGDGGNGGDVDTGGGARRRPRRLECGTEQYTAGRARQRQVCALLAHCSGHSRGIDQEHGGAQVLGDYIGAPGDNMVDDQADSAVGGFKSIVGRPADQEHPTAVVLEHPDRGAQAVSSVDEHVGPEPRHEAEVVPRDGDHVPSSTGGSDQDLPTGDDLVAHGEERHQASVAHEAVGRHRAEPAAKPPQGRSWDRKIAQ